MAKVILLGNSGAERIDAKIQKWILILMGILFIIQGSLNYYRNSDSLIDRFMVYLMLFGGVSALIYAWANFSKNSRFAPKLKLDDNSISLKGGLLKKNKVLKWVEIKSITLKPFRVDFKTENAVEIMPYECTSNISIEVKEAIREVAVRKNIEVLGG